MKKIPLLLLSLLLLGCSNNKGHKLYDFSVVTLDGKTITTASLKGKVTIIKIWATWCGPCVQEIPELNELAEQYRNDTNIVFLAITDESTDKIKHFLSARSFNYQHITDAKALKNTFQRGLIKTIPEHLVVNKDLKIVFDETGGTKNIKNKLAELIEELK